MNHKTFQKLFFDKIYSTINLFIKQPDDVISSKNKQASDYQGKNYHDNQQLDDVISSKNNQVKDVLKDSTKNQSSGKNNHKHVEGTNNLCDEATK